MPPARLKPIYSDNAVVKPQIITTETRKRHSQSKFVYFAKTSEPDFAAIDFTAFLRVDLSGSLAAPSI
jgi:hypothetical protein